MGQTGKQREGDCSAARVQPLQCRYQSVQQADGIIVIFVQGEPGRRPLSICSQQRGEQGGFAGSCWSRQQDESAALESSLYSLQYAWSGEDVSAQIGSAAPAAQEERDCVSRWLHAQML